MFASNENVGEHVDEEASLSRDSQEVESLQTHHQACCGLHEICKPLPELDFIFWASGFA